VYEPFPNDGAVITITLQEMAGRTLMTETILHKTREARDGHFNSGMSAGASESMDRLEALLATLG
jgi:uncharacterized protein YndB with AHSA1/START domain